MHPNLGGVEPAGTSLGRSLVWHLSWLSTFSSWHIALWLRLCPGIYFSESPARVSTLMQEGLLFAYTYPTDDSLISSFILCFYSVSLLAFVRGLTSAFASPTGLPERGTSVLCWLWREVSPSRWPWAPTRGPYSFLGAVPICLQPLRPVAAPGAWRHVGLGLCG